jgi:hypothetical protein
MGAARKHGGASLRAVDRGVKLPRMKKQKSLQVLALAGVAATLLATGCSSTSSGRADISSDDRAAYRMSSGMGWVPITDVRLLGKFPLEWNPVAHESYTLTVPEANPNAAASTATTAEYTAGMQPGDTFVEAAGAAPGGDARVRHVIRYTPFSGGL